jgi:hypothetical protein
MDITSLLYGSEKLDAMFKGIAESVDLQIAERLKNEKKPLVSPEDFLACRKEQNKRLNT